MKDEFTVVFAPTNLLRKWELFVKGDVNYVDAYGDFMSRTVTRKIGLFFKEDTALLQKAYLEKLQQIEGK